MAKYYIDGEMIVFMVYFYGGVYEGGISNDTIRLFYYEEDALKYKEELIEERGCYSDDVKIDKIKIE